MASLWADNIRRILGIHDLRAGEAAKLLGVSAQAVSEWTSRTRKEGTRTPHVATLERVAEFFELPGSLAWTPFRELLSGPLSDPERYDRVEDKIRRSRTKLRAVDSGKATGKRQASKSTDKAKAR